MTKLFEKIKDVVRHQSGGLTYRKKLNHDYDSEVLFDYKDGVGTISFHFGSPHVKSSYVDINYVEQDMSKHYEGTVAWENFKKIIVNKVLAELRHGFKNNDDVTDEDINNYIR